MKKFVVLVCAVALVGGMCGMACATLIQQTQGAEGRILRIYIHISNSESAVDDIK